MISGRLVSRLAQAALLLALSLGARPATVRAAGESDLESCPSRQCDYCPVDWFGECTSAYVSCASYECSWSNACDDNGWVKSICNCPICYE